jgi:IS5 family transposase
MRRKRRIFQHSNTQGYPLREHIDRHHPLVELADMIDWAAIDRVATDPYQPGPGRPIPRPRLIAALLYGQHAFNLPDEQVVAAWLEHPNWQVFTGETHLQTELPIDPSSLSRWRKHLGEVGMEKLLAQSIEAAKRAKVIEPSSVERVIVDTTVMEKSIAYPTDSALLERSREHLVKAARQCSLPLRQNYNREAPRLVQQIGRYAHAKRFRRMRAALRTLRSRVGRVQRHIARQLNKVSLPQRKDGNKLYALHVPKVECIAKGKASTPYEFGVMVSNVTTVKEGLVIGARSMPGNPYDGHPFHETLEQTEILSEVKPLMGFVDRGYRGVEFAGVQVWKPGQRRGVTRSTKAMIKRRSAIEPTIGHMKNDGKLGQLAQWGTGDAMHAVLCAAGHNIRLITNKFKSFRLMAEAD